ncbi:MAG: hypothetical protein Q8N82_00980, partial [Deltaproteobacteria bacterium]|nr:hypothetical protein [Deltaproteobacteria bacterium]
DGFVKSPFAALRGILRHCGVAMEIVHRSQFTVSAWFVDGQRSTDNGQLIIGFARLATEAFYCAVHTSVFCEIIID